MRNRLTAAPVQPILVPMALGARRAGVEAGAAALDEALRTYANRRHCHTLRARLMPGVTIPVRPLDPPEHRPVRPQPPDAPYLTDIAAAAAAHAEAVEEAIAAGSLALTLGGDHAVALGSIAGAAAATERLAVIWIDAHADLNTPETSPSGNVHGMPLAAALGRGPDVLTDLGNQTPKLRPEDTYLLGVRDLDPGERAWVDEGDIFCASMPRVDEEGLDTLIDALIARLQAADIEAIHVSFDVDALDPLLLPATGTPVMGGFTFREAARLLRRLRDAELPIRSLDWVELNPSLDPSETSTAVAMQLLAITLGADTI